MVLGPGRDPAEVQVSTKDRRTWFGKALDETEEFFTEDIPGVVHGAFPEWGGNVQGRVGSKSYKLVPEGKTPQGKVLSAQTAGLVGTSLSAVGQIPEQWVNAYLGTPGFAVMAVRDPVGTAKLMYESFKEQVENPAENLGYLSIALFGALGAGKGAGLKAPKVTKALKAGDVVEAVRIAKGSPLRRGKHGAPKDIERTLPSGAKTHRPIGISAPDKFTDPMSLPGRAGRARARQRGVEANILTSDIAAFYKKAKKLSDGEGMAIWAANYRRTPDDIIRALDRAQATTKRPMAKLRLKKLRKAAEESKQYVRDRKDGPGSEIRPEFKTLAETQKQGKRISDEMSERKAVLAEAGETEARYGVSREAQEYANAKGYALFGEEGDFFGGEVRPDLEIPGGIVHTPFKEARAARRVPPITMGSTTAGVPKGEPRHTLTGEAVYQGRFDPNAARAIGRAALESRKTISRFRAWDEIVKDPLTVTASDMIKIVKANPEALRNWRAIRVKSGANTVATAGAIDRFFGHDSLIGDRLGRGRSRAAVLRDLEAIALESDMAGQVKFFDNRKWKVQTVQLRKSSMGGEVWQTVNSLAKIGVLFSKLTGYITPQILGMTAMQLMEQGLGGPLRMLGKAPWVFKELSAEARARMAGVRGTGFGHALDPTGNPLNPVSRVNSVLADLFGLAIDSPFRNSSVMYWAGQLGYGAKLKKNGRWDVSKMEELLTAEPGTKAWDDLLQIEHLVGEHYGKFDQLGPLEQQIANLIFFYPWLRAASIYAAKLPLNHPARLAFVAQGGKVSQERTEDLLVEALMQQAGVSEQEATEAAQGIMREYPGIFPMEPVDALGNMQVVTPQSAALLQMPFDIKKLIDGFMGPEPLAAPLKMATPAVGLIGGCSAGWVQHLLRRADVFGQERRRPGAGAGGQDGAGSDVGRPSDAVSRPRTRCSTTRVSRRSSSTGSARSLPAAWTSTTPTRRT